LLQEIFSSGNYPQEQNVKTPIGEQPVHLFHYEDLSTLNLIFCRQDYYVPEPLKVVVDIGANVGISSLFWLTRNAECHVVAYEPVPLNVERLKVNLSQFQERYTIQDVAVSTVRGSVKFGVEETGKLGGIGLQTERIIEVESVHIMDVLDSVLTEKGIIDCLKIDTEGSEEELVKAIHPDSWKYIRCLNVEDYLRTTPALVPDFFSWNKRGSAMRFTNNLLA
ncbi:MAG: FkbM family methyltransferase, partial [Candidatus Kapaibacterium sp.]